MPERTEPKTHSGGIAVRIATGFGAGFAPVAPGTAGTLLAVPLGWLMVSFLGAHAWLQAISVAAASAIAVWSADRAAAAFGVEDPGEIVVDEMAGFLVAVALLPAGWKTLVAAFTLFRLFDITKPPPCRSAESLAGGLGIVADDLVAGLYANIFIRILCASGILSL